MGGAAPGAIPASRLRAGVPWAHAGPDRLPGSADGGRTATCDTSTASSGRTAVGLGLEALAGAAGRPALPAGLSGTSGFGPVREARTGSEGWAVLHPARFPPPASRLPPPASAPARRVGRLRRRGRPCSSSRRSGRPEGRPLPCSSPRTHRDGASSWRVAEGDLRGCFCSREATGTWSPPVPSAKGPLRSTRTGAPRGAGATNCREAPHGAPRSTSASFRAWNRTGAARCARPRWSWLGC